MVQRMARANTARPGQNRPVGHLHLSAVDTNMQRVQTADQRIQGAYYNDNYEIHKAQVQKRNEAERAGTHPTLLSAVEAGLGGRRRG